MSIRAFLFVLMIWLPTNAQSLSAEPVCDVQQLERSLETRIEALTNQARERHGLPPLVPIAYLERAARGHSEEMLNLGYFSHKSPTPGRTNSKMRIGQAGGWDTMTGENIYRARTTDRTKIAESAVQQWLSSPSHRKNILNPSFNSIGVGVAIRGNEFLITQDFSRQSIVVLSFVAVPSGHNFDVTLHAKVREGSLEGAAFVGQELKCHFQADGSRHFTLNASVPSRAQIAVSQKTGANRFHADLVLPVEAGLQSASDLPVGQILAEDAP